MDIHDRGRIARDHPAIDGHFPGLPIVPGVLLLTEVLHAAEHRLGVAITVVELPSIKFAALLRPEEPFAILVTAQGPDRLTFSVMRERQAIASGTIRYRRA